MFHNNVSFCEELPPQSWGAGEAGELRSWGPVSGAPQEGHLLDGRDAPPTFSGCVLPVLGLILVLFQKPPQGALRG